MTAQLVRGEYLNESQKQQVLAAFIYRPTTDNPRFQGQALATSAGMTDAEWIKAHSFYITQAGKLALTPKSARPVWEAPCLVWSFEGDTGEGWKDACDHMSEAIRMFQAGRWYVSGENLGWRHQSCFAHVDAFAGEQLLRSFLPRTDCTFKVQVNLIKRRITVVNSQHDAEGEIYRIYPR